MRNFIWVVFLFIFLSIPSFIFAEIRGSGLPSGLPTSSSSSGGGSITGITALNGNIGINSTIPGQQLDVQGTTRSTYFVGDGSQLTNTILNNGVWTDCLATIGSDGSICSGSTATTTGTISSSTNSLVVVSATGWTVGMGIAITNAGTGGNTELITYITSIVGTTFTLNDNAITTATGQIVNHDDTRALTTVVASNKNVYLRRPAGGGYNVTSAISVAVPINFMGDGGLNYNSITTNQTLIFNRGTTNDIFDVTTGNLHFWGFSINQAAGITPTAGSAFLLHHPSTTKYNGELNSIGIRGVYIGISVTGHISSWNIHDMIVSATNTGILVNNPSPAGGLLWHNVTTVPVTSNVGIGWHITQADTTTYDNIYGTAWAQDFVVDDSNGPVHGQTCIGCQFENGNPNVQISSTGTGTVDGVTFVGGTIDVTNGTNCLDILNHAKNIGVIGVYFQNCTSAILNNTDGGGIVAWGNIYDSNITSGKITTMPLSGNIGIGTTVPAATIDIIDNSNGASRLSVTNRNGGAAAQILFQLKNDAPNSLQLGMTSSGFSTNPGEGFVQANNGPIRLQSLGAFPVRFLVNSVEAARFINGGNFGIGNTAPVNLLDVSGSGAFGSYAASKTAPTNGLIVSGNTGIGTSIPSSLFEVGNQKFNVFSGGNVGIGSVTPGQTLDVQGTVRSSQTFIATGIASDAGTTDATVCEDTTIHKFSAGSGTLGICLGTSTRTVKQNIKSIPVGLDQIMRLNPIMFNYKPGLGYDVKKDYYGFIAEDVKPVLPILVGHNDKGEVRSADYVGMIPVIVKAIQEQQKEIDQLKFNKK